MRYTSVASSSLAGLIRRTQNAVQAEKIRNKSPRFCAKCHQKRPYTWFGPNGVCKFHTPKN